MAEHQLSPYLQGVLEAIRDCGHGVRVDGKDEPLPADLQQLANLLDPDLEDSDLEELRVALLGLRAQDCLIPEVADFPGMEKLTWWRVHPQCLN